MRSSSEKYKKWLLHVQNNWPSQDSTKDPLVCSWLDDKHLCAFDWDTQPTPRKSLLANASYATNYIDHLQSTNLLAVLGEGGAWCLLDPKGVVLAIQTSPELKIPLTELGIGEGFCFAKSLIGTTAFSLAQESLNVATTGCHETYKKVLHEIAFVCVPVRNDHHGLFLMALYDKPHEKSLPFAKRHLEALTHYPAKSLSNVMLFEDILDSMSEMVFVFGHDRQLQYTNDKARTHIQRGMVHLDGLPVLAVSAIPGEMELESVNIEVEQVQVTGHIRRQRMRGKYICFVKLTSQASVSGNWRDVVLSQCLAKDNYIDRFLTKGNKGGLRLFITSSVGAGEHYVVDYIAKQLAHKQRFKIDCMAGFMGHGGNLEAMEVSKQQFLSVLNDANGHILCIENIDFLCAELQSTLLKVLSTGFISDAAGNYQTFNIELICCASAGYDWETSRLNRLLYMKLSLAELTLRPLNQDLSRLQRVLDMTLEQLSLRERANIQFESEALSVLMNYHWPGNFLELFQTLENATQLCGNGLITLDTLPERMKKRKADEKKIVNIADAERNVILNAWQENGGRAASVANALGMSRTTLWRKMKKHGLTCQLMTAKA